MEYIEREAILNRLNKVHMDNRPFDAGVQFGVDHAISCIIEAPAADVATVVHGHWVDVTDEVQDILKERPPYVMLRAYKCSVCGRYEGKMEPYCNCGAKMDGGKA